MSPVRPKGAKNGTVIAIGATLRGVPTGLEEGLPGTGRLYTAFLKLWGARLTLTYTGGGSGGGGVRCCKGRNAIA